MSANISKHQQQDQHPSMPQILAKDLVKGTKGILGIHDTSGDMISWPKALESTNAVLAETALRQIRIDAKRRTGCSFEALNKKSRSIENQNIGSKLDNGAGLGDNRELDNSSGMNTNGNELEAHPLIPDLGGMNPIDLNPTEDNYDLLDGLSPEVNEKIDQLKKKKRKTEEELKDRLTNKLKAKKRYTAAPDAPAPKLKPSNRDRYRAPPPKPRPYY
jgi:hypothetical protein